MSFNHLSTRSTQDHHPEARFQQPVNVRNERGQDKFQSNFPEGFDERFRSTDFEAKNRTAPMQRYTQVNRPAIPVFHPSYPPSYNELNQQHTQTGSQQHTQTGSQQQDLRGQGIPRRLQPHMSRSSVRPRQQEERKFGYILSQLPPGNDYGNAQASYHGTNLPDYSRNRGQRSNHFMGEDFGRLQNQVENNIQVNLQQRNSETLERPERSYNINFNKLREWALSTNNTYLIFDMNQNVDGLSRLLKQDSVKFDWIYQLILTLKKIISVEYRKAFVNYILKCVCESRFLNTHLPTFLSEIKQKRNFPDTYGCFQKLVDVLEFMMKNLKGYSVHCKQLLINLLEIGQSLNVLSDGSDLTLRIQNLLHMPVRGGIRTFEVPMNNAPPYEVAKSFEIPMIAPRRKREKSIPKADDDNPPDDYQKMKIFPDTEELNTSVEPFLRANKTKGAYRDLKHYLDIHSRLMKEDYLCPIRNGLKDYKIALENSQNVKENDLRFYYKVKIAKISDGSDQGITHFVTFENSLLKDIEWEYSKRLMFGSLLVFSKDNFESTIFATVAHRDTDKLTRGLVEVMFQNNLEEVFTSSENDIFIMAETTAYFESYRHVLEGLQEMEEIPLERYIISCKREIWPPKYLHRDQHYNIASIMNKVFDEYPVPVLDDTEWPTAESTSLNESQLKALKLALANEMAVIQGPPGTGKTYVGLKIMRILLENKVMQNADRCKSPILVVCYTNHALDQFLEGILDFCQTGIIRVGGRSSSELLEEFNLKKLRQNPSLSKRMRTGIQTSVRNCIKHLRSVSRAINSYWQEVLRLETTILSVQDLKDEIFEMHYESLMDPKRVTSNDVHIMSTWLKASNANMDNFLNKAARRHLGKVIAEKNDDFQPDSNLTNKASAARLDFRSRVKIYHYWIKKYETFIEEEVEKLLSEGAPENDGKVQILLDAKEEIKKGILPDDILKPYMSTKAYEAIKENVIHDKKAEIDESFCVQHWLLDFFSQTDQLLDAIELLIKTKPEIKKPLGRSRTMVDNEANASNDRWVIDDSEDEGGSDKSEDDDSDDERRGTEEHNYGGKFRMSDIKELEDSYKQFQNKEIVMLQRAKMLTIDLTDRQDEHEEWQTANTMSYSKVFGLYNSIEPYTEEEASQITDLWSLQLRDRYRLYKFWVQERKDTLTQRLIDLTEEYKEIQRRKKEAYMARDAAILRRAKVIGMTTTGAARHRAVLQEVGCRIIVVEEAAEVLEAHIVTTLNKNCQHLILIGDHQQLRPSPTVHKLAVDYDLEISLFERLVKNNIPLVTLTEQHRMRPEISTYLRHIYSRLKDHFSVMRYENIRGVQSNVFFLQHEYVESPVDDTTSRANIHEARFLTGLCKYFIQHEYLGRQITVLAAYSGQVSAIRNEMEEEESTYEYVKVTSIDNYQGEENDIILLSLVRSNEMNEVGFLKTDNRVCVALSRAKMGLFVIGNFAKLESKSKLWKNIVTTAKENHVYGVGMKMVCVNHQHVTYIVNPEDFQKEVPEGGCNKPCKAILPCGHMCTRVCHSYDFHHETTKCMQPCPKQCPEGHPCQKDCYQECGKCEVRVLKKIPICGHEDQVPCYLDVDEATCLQNCEETLPCGHPCRGQCGVCMSNGSHQPCLEKVDIEWPCGHKNNMECRTNTSVDPCPTKCEANLDCGHKCKGTCGGCLSGRVHKACAAKCKKPLPCGHPCEGFCGVMCAPCKLRCPTSCRHATCGKLCGELCESCMEYCALTCQHKKCTDLCMDECKEPPCSKICNKPTPCKHKCMSLCGEACVCYQCEKDNFKFIENSSIMRNAHAKKEKARKVEIEKDTIFMKIPRCKHIFTLKQLDRYMNEQSYESGTSYIRCPVYPACKVPVEGISRYASIIYHRAEKRENVKFDIIQNAKTTESKIHNLTMSKNIVKRFCTVDEGEFLTRKINMIDSNHALALTMQFRFAFVLSKVYDIHRNFNQERGEMKIKKWKIIVSSIQQSMTPQLITEMTMEIHRLLLCEQIGFLNKTLKSLGVTLKDELKTCLTYIIKDLSKQQKLTREDKNKIQPSLEKLYDELYQHAPSDEWSADARKLQSQVKFVIEILNQSPSEDLITILHKHDPQEFAQATRVLEGNSDTDETDNETESEDESVD